MGNINNEADHFKDQFIRIIGAGKCFHGNGGLKLKLKSTKGEEVNPSLDRFCLLIKLHSCLVSSLQSALSIKRIF